MFIVLQKLLVSKRNHPYVIPPTLFLRSILETGADNAKAMGADVEVTRADAKVTKVDTEAIEGCTYWFVSHGFLNLLSFLLFKALIYFYFLCV